MEPFRTSAYGFGAPAPTPTTSGPISPQPASNPRLAQLQQFIANLPPEQVQQLRNAISSAPPEQRAQILQSAFSSVPGGTEALAGAANEVRTARATGQTVQAPPQIPTATDADQIPRGVPNQRPIEPPQPGTQTPPIVAPPGTPMQQFDFKPFEDNPNAYKDPAFLQGWKDTLSQLGTLSPEQRAVAEERIKAQGTIKPGQARGMNAWRSAINAARGFDDQPPTLPTATDADTMGVSAKPGIQVNSGMTVPGGPAGGGMVARRPSMTNVTGPGLQGRGVPNPRPRPGGGMKPMLPNETGQMPPKKKRPPVNPRAGGY